MAGAMSMGIVCFREEPLAMKKSCLLAATMLWGAGSAYAQSQPQTSPVSEAASEVGEIIVTAQKRTQRISEVPMSISAYDGATLERLGATELDRVAQMTPGLVIQLQDRLLPGISLRGITSDDTSPAAEPRVALFQDGVPITQIASAYGEMFDVDRVEVEKGPQSTLHGRSALNGGISIFQKMPGDTLGLEAKAGVGDHGQRLLQAVVNIPVSDSFGVRFGALKRQRDGFLEDTKGGTYNSVDGQAYRLTARYMPNDVFSFRFAGTYDVDDTDSGGAFKSNVFAPRNQQTGAVEGDVRFWTPTHLSTFGDLAQAYSRREIVGLSGTSDLTLSDRLDLTAISGYRWYTACQAGDIDGTPTNIIAYDLCNDGEQFSQELRLNIRRSGPFEGFVGASYFTASNAQTTDLGADERAMALLLSGVLHRYAPNGLTNNQINAALGTAAANYKPFHLDRRRQTADIETYDLFADGTFHLSDRLQAFVGGRLTWDDKTVSMQVSTPSGVSRLTGAALLMTLTPGGAVVRGSHSSNLTTGRAGVRYQLTPDVNVYAVYGVGKRPEVIDLDPSGAARILPAEELASAEVGVKYRLFDGALFGDASVYRFDYSNFQTFQRNGDRLEPVNAGAAEATGFETQATWRLADGLSVFGSYAYNHARFSGGAYDGNRFRSSPDDKFAFGVNAVIPTRFGELAITPVYSWQSKIFFSDDNDRADLQVRSRPAFSDKAVDEFQDAFGLFNLRLNLTPERGPWSFTVFGENLLDEKYVVDAGNTGDSFGMPTFIVGSRRNVRFEVSAKF